MSTTRVRPHFAKRGRTRYKVAGHTRKTVGSLAMGRTGERFKTLAGSVARTYVAKGYSRQRAARIGKAVAGKVFWRKFGKRSGTMILRRER